MAVHIHVSDPSELFAALTCLVGYRPANAIVAYALSAQGELVGAAYLDVTECPQADAASEWSAFASRLVARLLVDDGAPADPSVGMAAFVCADSESGALHALPADPAVPVLERMRAELGPIVRADDCWIVGPERYRHLACALWCCPPAGRPHTDTTSVLTAFGQAGHSCENNKETWLAMQSPDRADRLSARRAAARLAPTPRDRRQRSPLSTWAHSLLPPCVA